MSEEKPHRHRYVMVRDSDTSFTSHQECAICGRDPWVERWRKAQERRARKAGA